MTGFFTHCYRVFGQRPKQKYHHDLQMLKICDMKTPGYQPNVSMSSSELRKTFHQSKGQFWKQFGGIPSGGFHQIPIILTDWLYDFTTICQKTTQVIHGGCEENRCQKKDIEMIKMKKEDFAINLFLVRFMCLFSFCLSLFFPKMKPRRCRSSTFQQHGLLHLSLWHFIDSTHPTQDLKK